MSYSEDLNVDLMHQGDQKVEQNTKTRLNCFTDIQNWVAHNFLQMNPKKTEILLIATNSANTELTNMLGPYSHLIAPQCRNLSVTFDNNLTLNSHIKFIKQSASFNS